MARPRLSSARKAATNRVASKLAGKATQSTATVPTMPIATAVNTAINTPIQSTQNNLITIPGLASITPDSVGGMMPKFEETSYQITDPLNPSESIPQATEAQYERGLAIYQGATRALQLVGAAMDVTRERFNVVGKQAKAVGAGIKAATETQRIQGDYLDYQNVLQVNEQKGIALDVSRHKTVTDLNKSVHDKSSLDEKLRQSEIAADMARGQNRDKQSKLYEFKKSFCGDGA